MLAEKAALLGQTDDQEDDEPRSTPRPALTSPTGEHSDRIAQPLTTPGDQPADPLSSVSSQSPEYADTTYAPPKPMSEKARGKMKAVNESETSLPIDPVDEVPDEELMKVAASGVGPNGYVPTQDWVASWQKG